MQKLGTPFLLKRSVAVTGSAAALLVLLGLLAPGLAQAQAQDPGVLAAAEFSDQFGTVDSLARRAGAPVVAMVVGIKALPMIEKWERDLTKRVPGLRFLNVVDLPSDVPVDLERTAATLRKRVPAEVSVLMDPERQWATAFALDTALPNLLLFDARGQLVARFRGRWTAAVAEEVAAEVTALRPVDPQP
ncbi:MAG: hypothetical protein EXR82_06690 [Gammaproteobacteria bacterium]|jgi:hypothetical protein|nr:hypothetical protein [Gammaproteobacteria bacterium]